MGKFRQNEVDDLLVRCHRRCCICHRFCGVKIETDHIEPSAEGGADEIANAIAVCFECHAEIHSYNDQHPRGRKFRPQELRKHKEQWLAICRERPEFLTQVSRSADVGPLQALIDELEVNLVVSKYAGTYEQGSPFLDDQFKRAIQQGAIATLQDSLRISIIEAYVACKKANQLFSTVTQQAYGSPSWGEASNLAGKAITEAGPKIAAAWSALVRFLGSEK
jgi:hypothetical protein